MEHEAWWGPNQQGYHYPKLEHNYYSIGTYKRDEALKIVANSVMDEEVMIPKDNAKKFILKLADIWNDYNYESLPDKLDEPPYNG